MKHLKIIIQLVLGAVLISSCTKHEVKFLSTPVSDNMAEFQLHYFVPLVSGAVNNINKAEVNGIPIASLSAPLTTYSAIPNGAVGKFFTSSVGVNSIKLYRGTNLDLVYNQQVTLNKGKQNVFVYDFNKSPIVFDNAFPYLKNTTKYTDSIAWIRFYNFLYENSSGYSSSKLQYQYQYTVNNTTGEKSAWINVGKPVAFGECTGWTPVVVNKTVDISAGSARIDYKLKIIGADGSDQGDLQVLNSSSKYVNYSEYRTASIGRDYHHVLSGMRAAVPNCAVRVFTAL
ncbi:MAG: hypothetical protein IPH58_17365 [Sphingobacteriales bacterium]|nr:hypothetical protein [Sphingobacteriales bacterium]